MTGAAPLLSLRGLVKHYPIRGGLLQRIIGQVRAVDGVSFDIWPGEVFGLAGESGSGKSTIARMVLGLVRPTAGAVLIDGHDALRLRHEHGFRRNLQMVSQNPGSSLNPRRSVGQSIAVPLEAHGHPRATLRARIGELLDLVELQPSFAARYPHELSGGQKQRVAIARALALSPRLVVLDEPTSALDVSVQAKIVELLKRLGRELGMAYLFISHDLSLMRSFAHRIGILYLGALCEIGTTEEVFGHPNHPYTQTLLSAIPVISAEEEALKPAIARARGEIPSAAAIPRGCRFHPRCPFVYAPCPEREPELMAVGGAQRASCFLVRDGRQRRAVEQTHEVSP